MVNSPSAKASCAIYSNWSFAINPSMEGADGMQTDMNNTEQVTEQGTVFIQPDSKGG